MSKLTGYTEFLTVIIRCLDENPPAPDIGDFNIYTGPVSLPLNGIATSTVIQSFYEARHQAIRSSCLTAERKTLWSKFAREVVLAYAAVSSPPQRTVPAKFLQKPIQHILDALATIMELRNHDARSPVRIVELIPYDSEQDNAKAEDYWREVKLESLRPCLQLAIRLLEVMMPDRIDFWEEYRETLASTEWKDTFINDSPESRRLTLMGPSDRAELRAQLLAARSDVPQG
ncbi:uncharacterized protein B0I36DRAFT_62041 [Microdochium trichocladiopsis]|uniref:Uncharacterized protein n=1 Tax=Microdochium trichocladiopsis TaxID=1682393 RepID=A0A9P8YFN3_9PEZI|nr:uncharacterized protein B0I36DRAFT_62041 [Microdochium trichocladiopsis]KAH7037125.1 hypothetical protein B0I36DRAFT_62041 [Microdochium trichocladiopsis]